MPLSEDNVLETILKDREKRFSLRQDFANKQWASVSLNFNIPGFPKNSKILKQAFSYTVNELRQYLTAHRISVISEEKKTLNSICGSFFIQAITYTITDKEVKTILEEFEETHFLHRLLDVDLFNAEGLNISSGKNKKCMLCSKTAYQCAQEQNHPKEDYLNFINKIVKDYIAIQERAYITNQISEIATKSLLYEVSIENKPGLICPSSNGSHQDMDYFTFLNSIAALSPHWKKMAELGYKYAFEKKDAQVSNAIIPLRLLGIEAEASMCKATNHVNTHKGSIFLIGHACFSAAYTITKLGKFDQELFSNTVKQLGKDLTKKDFLQNTNFENSNGRKCFNKYGIAKAGGARLEVELGFPTVLNFSLSYLKNLIGEKKFQEISNKEWQKMLNKLLLFIMSKNNDTNILSRKDHIVLEKLKGKSEKALKMIDIDNDNVLNEIHHYCKDQHISPGGSADLLSLTLFVFFVEDLQISI